MGIYTGPSNLISFFHVFKTPQAYSERSTGSTEPGVFTLLSGRDDLRVEIYPVPTQ